ncbi:hypothetical protein A6R68_08189 [Neotoma lepida]|uniref:Uncharacterized protein n=1 Tax=Neotoma lepida TaxID=56216 RepID=A0A1A6G3D6_NEOLE|nr:hypothetical protein A6R68_08189 [Neotoma lepida]
MLLLNLLTALDKKITILDIVSYFLQEPDKLHKKERLMQPGPYVEEHPYTPKQPLREHPYTPKPGPCVERIRTPLNSPLTSSS